MNKTHRLHIGLGKSGLIAALIALLTACGGGVSVPVTTQPVDEKSMSTAVAGEVNGFFKSVLLKNGGGDPRSIGVSPVSLANPAAGGDATGTGSSINSSLTNNQEAGVDEDDLIKTNGQRFFAIVDTQHISRGSSSELQWLQRLPDGTLTKQASVPVGDQTMRPIGLQVSSDFNRLAVLTRAYSTIPLVNTGAITITLPYLYIPKTKIDLYSAQGSLSSVQRLVIDGSMVGSRRVGNTLYLTMSWSPQWPVSLSNATLTTEQRAAAIDQLQPSDWIPKITVDGQSPQDLLSETDCFLQKANASPEYSMTLLVAIDLSNNNFERRSRCIVGGHEALYMTDASLYLATSRWQAPVDSSSGFSADFKTDIHKFALLSTGVNYKGSGTVDGHLGWDSSQKPYRMSEYNGDLRVLSFTGSFGWVGGQVLGGQAVPQNIASPATLTVLREGSSGQLTLVGQLPNSRRPAAIGKPNEQIYAVRFVGTKGYVVTFRQTDPLYVLNLADPTDPSVDGELEIPGFNTYLMPLTNNLLFGVGRQADAQGRIGGSKVDLFDVANPAAPKLLQTINLGGSGSTTGVDYSPHALSRLSVLRAGESIDRIAIPMDLTETGQTSIRQFGLHRFEVNLSKKQMTSVETLGFRTVDYSRTLQPDVAGNYEMGIFRERSVQVEQSVYYLSGGEVKTYAW